MAESANPPPRGASRCLIQMLAHRLWSRAETLAELDSKHRQGWHPLKRNFASDLVDPPLDGTCELGSWKNAGTVFTGTCDLTRDNAGRRWETATGFGPGIPHSG